MKPFSGQATIRVRDHTSVVFLSLDMEKGELEAELPADALPDDAVRIRDGEPDEVIVTDIRIPLPTGTLYAERIPDVLMGCESTVNSSTGTSPISTALNPAGKQSLLCTQSCFAFNRIGVAMRSPSIPATTRCRVSCLSCTCRES